MNDLKKVVKFLDSTLNNNYFKDFAINGLQVDSQNQEINKIAVAVDAGESVIEKAIIENVDLLVVHHGIFWGTEQTITGSFGRKISKLIKAGCSLYASHLPLDAHPEYGNNAVMAKILNLADQKGFAKIEDQNIGIYGNLKTSLNLEELSNVFKNYPGILKDSLKLQFGKDKNKVIGIVSGSGSGAINECYKLGIDCLISGESKQEVFHMAKEEKINCLFLGHYGTETFGVNAIADLLKSEFNVDTLFIDEPTGI